MPLVEVPALSGQAMKRAYLLDTKRTHRPALVRFLAALRDWLKGLVWL